MSVILHASDLHFGKADPAVVESFRQEVERQKPDLVILSGDFTQVGSNAEFKQARDFIDRISAPVFTVPGNHDIPRFNSWQRFFDPMKRYRRHISPLVDTIHEDDECYVVGINTARAVLPHWNWANGMISKDQIDFVHRNFRYAPNDKVRIFVCHHPLLNVQNAPIDTVVWGSTELVQVLESQHVDLVLTGHIHHASILPYSEARGPVMIGSASATSMRLRKQSNGYNIIRLSSEKIDIELVHWDGASHVVFEALSVTRRTEP
ncbi:MAG TPA: metallophosphoesterase [Micavibrio sp.]|nr:metallophosphoesterase [Micavibrio sp.]